MKRRILPALLAFVMALSLLPAAAFAAETDLPDWYFLFAIFKNVDTDVGDRNGVVTHITYSMPQEEINLNRDIAIEFEEYMNSVGVIRAHVEIVEIDTPVTELQHRDGNSSFLGAEQAAPLLEGKVDLDRYDHVTCILDLGGGTGYAGISPFPFKNGTGISCNNHGNWDYIREYYRYRTDNNLWHVQLYVHEFLHFMERMDRTWGAEFTLHRGGKTHYTDEDEWKTYYTDAILNQVEDEELFPDGGTGVHPTVWQHPPHVLRTMTELTVPSGVTSIGIFAFAENKVLTRVFIPSSVTSIGGAAFQNCTNLTSVSLPASITHVEQYTFANCFKLADIYYGGSETQWKAVEISSISNGSLCNATIHYNSLMADVKTSDWFAQPVTWALENGVTNGTGGGNFSPARTCNQGEILTFLWRAKGSPNPAGAVTGTQFYARAVQWAREQGLIGGSFNAGAPCTRADAVTYLWKLAGSPSAGNANFSDVPATASYAQAVAWAVSEGVTNGTSDTTFSPNDTCTRGQIVTFLYRALG